MCRYFCIGLLDPILKDKSLLEYKNLFPPNEYKKNDKEWTGITNQHAEMINST